MRPVSFSIFLSAVLSLSSFVAGQDTPPRKDAPSDKQESPPAKNTVEKPVPTPAPSTLAQEIRSRPGYGHDANVNRRIVALVRLRDAMFDKLKISPEQRKKIESMFDDYMAALIYGNHRSHDRPAPGITATPQDLPELRKQLVEAEKSGAPKETIDSLKAKINAATFVLEPSIVDEPVYFFDYVRRELDDEQRKEFATILVRWDTLRVFEFAPDNDFKQLRRSTRDPELLEGNDELGKKLDTLIVEAQRTIPLGKERIDKDVMNELAKNTRPKIHAVLTASQKEHFEKTLAMLKQWENEEPEIAKKLRDRLKDHKPAHASSQTSSGEPSPQGGKP